MILRCEGIISGVDFPRHGQKVLDMISPGFYIASDLKVAVNMDCEAL